MPEVQGREGALNVAIPVLTISYQHDPSDNVGRVRAQLEGGTFSGAGACWATPDMIEDFGRGLDAYPILAADPPSFKAGYCELQGDDVVIGVTIRPADPRGNLVVEVEIAEDNDRWVRVRTRFVTHYPQIEAFKRALLRVAKGEAEAAVLEGV
jgi:hypothetical protein